MPAGQTLEQLVRDTDLAPTFAELGGVPVPSTVDGRSLVPLLVGETPLADWRSAFLVEHWAGGLGYPEVVPTYEAVRTEEHKYVEYNSGERELYDLDADPYELENFHESA